MNRQYLAIALTVGGCLIGAACSDSEEAIPLTVEEMMTATGTRDASA